MNDETHDFTRNIVRYISRLERWRRRYLDEHLQDYKLHGSMFQIVLFLDKEPGSSQDVLVEFLGIDKSGVARKCRHLEDLGYIVRKPSQENRRQNRIYLTEPGQTLLPVIRNLLFEWRGIITKGIDLSNQIILQRLLEKMMDNAEKKL